MDGGDEGDDDDGNSSGYDADDKDEDVEEEEEEEEEHLAPADSTVVIPIDELVSAPKGIEPTIPPPSTDTATIRARITIRPQTFISLQLEAKVERLLAMPTPSQSPLSLLSPPSAEEHLARCTAPAALPSPPLPPFSYPPPLVDRKDGIPESEQPPHKRLCLSTLVSTYEVGENSTMGRGVDYGFTNTVETEMRHRVRKEATAETLDINTNNTNPLNVVSAPVSVVGPSRALNDDEPSYSDDPSIPHLEDIYASLSEGIFTDSSYDDKGVVIDFNNLETTVNVSPTPTTRIHTIHPKT
nr:hypothetical protein [Tanacetum cinerariifolium]